jgi:RNA polymerase sigma-70 factor (ECF subfamily)
MKDKQLWREIYEKYAKRMFFICLRYASDKEQAEDMMHDGFLQIFQSLGSFTDRGEGSLRAWMERVMINTCLQYLRKRDLLRESVSLDRTAGLFAEAGSQEELEQAAERIPVPVLHRFIAELPPGYRAVFNLYVFEGWSHKEIAEKLGIKERTSSSQYHRARNSLARKIKEYEEQHR